MSDTYSRLETSFYVRESFSLAVQRLFGVSDDIYFTAGMYFHNLQSVIAYMNTEITLYNVEFRYDDTTNLFSVVEDPDTANTFSVTWNTSGSSSESIRLRNLLGWAADIPFTNLPVTAPANSPGIYMTDAEMQRNLFNGRRSWSNEQVSVSGKSYGIAPGTPVERTGWFTLWVDMTSAVIADKADAWRELREFYKDYMIRNSFSVFVDFESSDYVQCFLKEEDNRVEPRWMPIENMEKGQDYTYHCYIDERPEDF